MIHVTSCNIFQEGQLKTKARCRSYLTTVHSNTWICSDTYIFIIAMINVDLTNILISTCNLENKDVQILCSSLVSQALFSLGSESLFSVCSRLCLLNTLSRDLADICFDAPRGSGLLRLHCFLSTVLIL